MSIIKRATMHLVAVATISFQIAQHLATFITLRDANFYEEDGVLNASLFQRMAVNNPAYEPRPVEVRELMKPILRESTFERTNPTEFQVKQDMIHSMKQLIYSTQYRLRELEPLIQKYGEDIRYRVAFIYCRLKTLEEEMEEQYSVLKRKIDKRRDIEKKFLIYLFYYEHDLRRFVDVVYIVEHFYKLHDEYLTMLHTEEQELKEEKKRQQDQLKKMNATSSANRTAEMAGGDYEYEREKAGSF